MGPLLSSVSQHANISTDPSHPFREAHPERPGAQAGVTAVPTNRYTQGLVSPVAPGLEQAPEVINQAMPGSSPKEDLGFFLSGASGILASSEEWQMSLASPE